MNSRIRKRRQVVEHDDVHRWLVSYADYMTLLFALFVVLYAMAMVNEKPFDTVTESIGRVFQSSEDETKNKGEGKDILPVNSVESNVNLYGDAILEVDGPNIIDGKKVLSNIEQSDVGTQLESLEDQLHTALFDLVESGYAKLQVDGDWLEIELNSALLFPSGSASPTNAAKSILSVINDIIGDVTNFIRVRGYTDNQPIQNEVFSSNWELSVTRATTILRVLEELKINPARMAIEGYGQYYPNSPNNTEEGRAGNRRVVIAISKYGLQSANLLSTPTMSVEEVENMKSTVEESVKKPNEIRVIQLENGGIRITSSDDVE